VLARGCARRGVGVARLAGGRPGAASSVRSVPGVAGAGQGAALGLLRERERSEGREGIEEREKRDRGGTQAAAAGNPQGHARGVRLGFGVLGP
jgi:hypothetical protein